jgi:arylsulfatase
MSAAAESGPQPEGVTVRSLILHGIVLLIVGPLITPPASIRAETPRPPNIVFILADDLGYAELGCYGQKKIRTPYLDRLAKEGIRFTQFYCGNAVCAPSRCVLMTGKHAGHAFVRDNRSIKPDSKIIGQILIMGMQTSRASSPARAL